MPVAFVCNKQLTVCYSDLARKLHEAGEQCFFLSPSTRWTRFLLGEGWPPERILNFAEIWTTQATINNSAKHEILERFEIPSFATANHVIRMCRGLSRRPREVALAYIALAFESCRRFLSDNRVEIVFAEGTWGFELAVHRSAMSLNIPAVTPSTTRIPSDRFAFMDAASGRLHRFRQPSSADTLDAREFLASWRNRPVAPAYARSSAGYSPRMAHWPGELATAVLRPELDRGDETLWPISRRMTDRILRRLRVSAWSGSVRTRADSGRPFVLYCLQHQPEAAVDVYGSFHSDQRALIERLVRILPTTHDLIVREHRGALGDRSRHWFKDVAALPNTYIGSPFEDIYPLLRQASAVVTVSGTVAYEAALLGTPALALADMFFSPLLAQEAGPHCDPLGWRINEILDPSRRHEFTPADEVLSDFMSDLFANSCPGNPVQLFASEQQRQSVSHLAKEAEGFQQFISGVRTSAVSPIPAPPQSPARSHHPSGRGRAAG